MEVDPGDPLSAVILAILCNRESSKKIILPKREYLQISPGMILELKSTPDSVSVELVKR